MLSYIGEVFDSMFWTYFAMAWWLVGSTILLLPIAFSLSLFTEGYESDSLWEMSWGIAGMIFWTSSFLASLIGWMIVAGITPG